MNNEFRLEGFAFDGVFKFIYPSFGDPVRGADKLFEIRDSSIFSKLDFSCNECMLFRSGRGVLRGMHYQSHSSRPQNRLIYLLSGCLFVAIVDFREEGNTYGKWQEITISETDKVGVYIPGDFAIGTLAEEDSTFLVFYDGEYISGYDRGFRFDDETVGIEWPMPKKELIVADKDLLLPKFGERKR